MNLRTMAFAAIALVAVGTSAASFAQSAPGPQGTPPPPPVPNSGPTSGPLISPSSAPTALPSSASPPTTAPAGATALPSPDDAASGAPATGGRRGRRGTADGAGPSPSPSPTDTPEPPQFASLDGVWEVAFQPLNGGRAFYSHLYVTQNGNTLTGKWNRDGKTVMPITGTFDGRLLKVTATNGASTFTFSGYEENYMDMVGLFSDGDPKHQGTPFTAAHRKRERDRDVKVK